MASDDQRSDCSRKVVSSVPGLRKSQEWRGRRRRTNQSGEEDEDKDVKSRVFCHDLASLAALLERVNGRSDLLRGGEPD